MVLVEHHVKYKEVHGVDETVWLEMSEHVKLHARLRKEGKCKIPAKVLSKISTAAQKRTEKSKQYQKQYEITEKRKQSKKTEKSKQWHAQYNKQNKYTFSFYETIMPHIVLHEHIAYNRKTGNIIVASYFQANQNLNLFEQTI